MIRKVLLITTLVAVLFISKSHAADCQLGVTPQCAQYCVHHCCSLLGVPISLRQACELLPPKDKGESLLEIGDTIKRIGLEYSAEKVSFDELLAGSFPVIAHVNVQRAGGNITSHYIVIESFGPSGLKIEDSLRRGSLSRKNFQDIWDGTIMRVTKPKDFHYQGRQLSSSSEKVPHIQFNTLFIDAGDIPQTEDGYTFVFSLRNIGNTDLHISKVKTNCGCTVIDDFPHTLASNQTGQIKIRYTFNSSRGNFSQSAAVMSDDTDFPVAQLAIVGNGRQEVKIAPAELSFGKIIKGDKAVAQCFVSYTGDAPFDIKSAVTSFKPLTLAVKPLIPQLLRELRSGDGEVALNECTNRYVLEGSLDTADLTIKEGKAIIEITTNLPKASTLKIPVNFEVVHPIMITPSKLFIGEVATGTSINKTVTVKSLHNSKIKIDAVNTQSTGLQISYPQNPSEEITITFSGSISDPNQLADKNVEITLTEATSGKSHKLTIPVCGLFR